MITNSASKGVYMCVRARAGMCVCDHYVCAGAYVSVRACVRVRTSCAPAFVRARARVRLRVRVSLCARACVRVTSKI